jgi:hypothetical protein
MQRRSQGFTSGKLLFAESRLAPLFSSIGSWSLVRGRTSPDLRVSLVRCPSLIFLGSHLSGGSLVRGFTSSSGFMQVIVSSLSPSLPYSAPQLRLYPLAAVAQISLANSVFLLCTPLPFFLSCLSPSIPDSLLCLTGIRGIAPKKVENGKSNARERFQCILWSWQPAIKYPFLWGFDSSLWPTYL